MSNKEQFEPDVDFQLPKTHLESYDPDIVWGWAMTLATSDLCSKTKIAINFSEWTGLYGESSLSCGLGPEGIAELLTEFFGSPKLRNDGSLIWERDK